MREPLQSAMSTVSLLQPVTQEHLSSAQLGVMEVAQPGMSRLKALSAHASLVCVSLGGVDASPEPCNSNSKLVQ